MKTRAVTWHIDPAKYRVHAFVDGKLAPTLNLRPLFEQYHWEAAS